MKHMIKILSLISALFVCSANLYAQSLTPEGYMEIELQIRQITNEGMQQRLFLLQLQNRDSIEDQNELDVETIDLINAVFEQHGVTAGMHAAFGTQNSAAIEGFLINNPEKQQQLDLISAEFQSLSSQISAELESN